ncbi:hypothetical protein C1646_741956 [Rhizophagus diaphanus]|nr:hypothetical protein C1646_741956 [Rhizophagus diaphanus] [Rhizophagus sp. MUCL 43196]
MDLDSRGHSKLVEAWNSGRSDEYTRKYTRILEKLFPLADRHDYETPEMWCSRIRDPFRKILEEHHTLRGGILSGNGYIKMFGKLIERSDRVHGIPSNYIYCSVCDSLVFIPENGYSSANCYRDNHFKSCINNTISKEHTRRKEILKSIDRREFQIWQYKQFILKEEAKIKRLQLEFASQSFSHSEKNKLASVSYDHDPRLTDYEIYAQSKATIVKNTMPSAPNFEPAYISPAGQEMVSPTSYQSSAPNETISEIFISSRYSASLQELQEETRIFGKTNLGGGIISRDMYYYYINGELIEFNWKVDHFYSRYSHILYSTRTWAEEKQNQLACRLNWLSFELVKKLLQEEGYVLLYGTFEWPIMIKWTQNPKYYLNTGENRNSRHFVRKDILGPHDIKSIESHSRLTSDWWYKHKAWVDKFAISQFYKFCQNKNIV